MNKYPVNVVECARWPTLPPATSLAERLSASLAEYRFQLDTPLLRCRILAIAREVIAEYLLQRGAYSSARLVDLGWVVLSQGHLTIYISSLQSAEVLRRYTEIKAPGFLIGNDLYGQLSALPAHNDNAANGWLLQ